MKAMFCAYSVVPCLVGRRSARPGSPHKPRGRARSPLRAANVERHAPSPRRRAQSGAPYLILECGDSAPLSAPDRLVGQAEPRSAARDQSRHLENATATSRLSKAVTSHRTPNLWLRLCQLEDGTPYRRTTVQEFNARICLGNLSLTNLRKHQFTP